MKKVLAIIMVVVLAVSMVAVFTGCRQVYRVNYNISKEADNFGVYRRIVVTNVRDNFVMYELEGFFALENSTTNELIVTSEIGKEKYKKDYIYLNEYTSYVVEQLDSKNVSPYSYKFIIYPEMLIPVEVEVK